MSLDGFIQEYLIFWGFELDFWVKIVIFHFLESLLGPLAGTPLPGLSGKGQKSRMSKFLIKTIKLVINQHNLMIYRVLRAQNGSKSREKFQKVSRLGPDRGVNFSYISEFLFMPYRLYFINSD